MSKPTLLILAAGMGSRYGGLKQLDGVGPSGETIMEYSVYDAIRAGFGKVVFVIRESFAQDFSERFVDKLKGKIDTELVYQELNKVPAGITFPADRVKPWGTGHAIWVAKDAVKEPFAVINADDFYGKEAYEVTARFLTSQANATTYAMCGYQLSKTLSDFGTVSRGVCSTNADGNLITVTERTAIARQGNTIVYKDGETTSHLSETDIVSMNFWGFHPSLFQHLEEKFIAFAQKNAQNIKSEFYIPFVVDDLMKEGKVTTKVLTSSAEWFGVTYQEDRPATVEKLAALTSKGIYPKKLW
jgi:UTP-glucose-1-phosphate uridylyltransferase